MARKRKAPVRKTPAAIKRIEGDRKLTATELKVLLREALSKICRIRDGYTCYVTGRVCGAGIGPGTGQAAHLIPINQLPPHLRYDPRVVVWMEGAAHSDFDGRTRFGQKPANQAAVWGKMAREDPERFLWLTNIPRSRGDDKSRVHDLRDQLEYLRSVLRNMEETE